MATAAPDMNILEIISTKEKEVARLQEFIKHLRAAAESQGLLTRENAPQSLIEMAVIVLQEAKRPMHTKEITNRIQARFGRVTKPASLGTQLYKAAEQRGVLFVKDAKHKNTYRLREAR